MPLMVGHVARWVVPDTEENQATLEVSSVLDLTILPKSVFVDIQGVAQRHSLSCSLNDTRSWSGYTPVTSES